MSLKGRRPLDLELGSNQPIGKLVLFDLERLNISGKLFAFSFEYHLQRTCRAVVRTAGNQDHQMGSQNEWKRLRRKLREIDPGQIDSGGGPGNLTNIEVFTENSTENLHALHGSVRCRESLASPLTLGAMTSHQTLSEAESKAILAPFGVPFNPEHVVANAAAAVQAARGFAGPVAIKLTGDSLAHKTERGLVRLNCVGSTAVEQAAQELLDAATDSDGEVGLLVAPMVRGLREFIVGATNDRDFGPTVMLGLGGVLAEAVHDTVFRLAPVTVAQASAMVHDLQTRRILEPFRGEPAVDIEALAQVIVAVSDAADSLESWEAIELNPVIISDGQPLAVDALVVWA